MITVAHRSSLGKFGTDEMNEDATVVAPPYFAVIDGVTSKQSWSGIAPGRLAAQTLADVIPTFPANLSARDAIDLLTSALAEQGLSSEQPAAAVVVFSASRREVWSVGDGWAMIDGFAHRFQHEIERRGAAARAALLQARLQTTDISTLRDRDVGREMIAPLLESEAELSNIHSASTLSFGRIDGRPVPDDLIVTLPVPRSWKRVVLASDGYPTLGDSFEATEAALTARLARDPLLIEDPPETKGKDVGQVSFDDRSWLELERV